MRGCLGFGSSLLVQGRCDALKSADQKITAGTTDEIQQKQL